VKREARGAKGKDKINQAMKKINIGIFGATGYTGIELFKILTRHGGANVVFATSESNPGARLSDVLPCPYDITLVKSADAPVADVDVVFSCLPHAASAELCKPVLDAGKKVIDLSADFRLRDPAVYEKWYKHAHPFPQLLSRAVYGLSEVNRSAIHQTDLVGNPGCYPTSVALGALPVLEMGALADGVVISDSKSGVSGAGRKATLATSFVEVNESLAPYNIGHVHRHVPEMEQAMNDAWRGPGKTRVVFTPHLLPISRGMLSTLYMRLTADAAAQDWQAIYQKRFANEPFVRVLPAGQIATIAHANHTNYAAISIHRVDDLLIVVSCIDNLIKGASGQAAQNMNLMFGFDEREGLM